LAVQPDSNKVFVGGKPLMNYVTAVVMQFTTKNNTLVEVLSRGKFISKAVDCAEVVTNNFLKSEVVTKTVSVGSSEFQNGDGKKVRVSSIQITLQKKKKK